VGNERVPDATISRLVVYLRVLEDLERRGIKRTSSEQLAEEAKVTAFQVRKDLAYFGSYGTRGVGYSVSLLKHEIRKILGLTRKWRLAIVGMGRLGQALADYPGLADAFEPVGFFDVDPQKVGQKIARGEIESVDGLEEAVRDRGIEIAVLAVPAESAQEVADRLVAAGIKAILNFTPTVLDVPARVPVENVDFLVGLARLTYYVTRETGEEWVQ